MPAFDPVRDAVLNSPITSSLALPQSARMHPDAAHAKSPHPGASSHPRHPPSSAPGSGMSIVTSTAPSSTTTSPSEPSPGTALVSPQVRRATDLSMLLNDTGPMDTPLFTPTTPRAPTGFTHLLHGSDDGADVEQLSQFTPMRRRSSATMSETSAGTPRETRESSYFTHPGSINARASLSSSSSHGLPLQREPFGLALPGAAGAPPPMLASTTLAFPSSSGSRPSTATSIASGPPASRPSTAGQPLGSSSSGASASMPPPAQAPQRSPLISTSSPSAVSAARAPAPQRATRPPSPTKPVPSPISVLPTAPTPFAPAAASASAPASAPAPPPVTASAPSTSSVPPPTTQKPQPPPRQKTTSGNGVPPKPVASIPPKPQSSLPPPSASLPPKPEPPPSPPPSQMKRSAVPYAPRRITPAGSVLIPLSPAEMEKYRNYSGGVGTMILRKKKRVENLLGDGPAKREREDPESEEGPRKKRRSGDVAVVVEHYNARPDVGVAQRQESPIIGLKSFNNWVKSVLITRFAHPVLAASPGQRRGQRMRGRVLDMGCGKGGDLTKWAKANVAEYIGLDIAAVSVDQARQRHATSRGARFTAEFFALDCYTSVLSDALPPNLLSTPFDVVSMQFCMHYAFESEAKARTMLRNVATWLRPSGMFIGTIPNAQQLMEHLDELPEDAEELSWGNSVYKIRFEERDRRPMFGHRYWFFLQDAVDDVPEYVVHWDNFVRLASEYGLELVYKKEFHEIFEEHSEHAEFAPLLQRMHVVDANGESQMDEDQWEAANVYVGFAFEKR